MAGPRVGIYRPNGDIAAYVGKVLQEYGYRPTRPSVVVKPNVGNARAPSSYTVTNPAVVEGVINHVRAHGADAVIAEGAIAGIDTMAAFAAAGYTELARRLGVELVDLNTTERRGHPWPFGELALPRLLDHAELINVAKMKTHIQTGVTLAVKNLKGLLDAKTKKRFHRDLGLHEPIRELGRLIRPSLSLIDGIGALEGNGPGTQGRRKSTRLLLVGDDAQSLDRVATLVMGLAELEVEHLEPVDLSTVELVGCFIEEARVQFLPPGTCYRRFKTNFWWNESCSGCNHAISAAQRRLLRKPWFLPTLVSKMILGRSDFVSGRNPQLSEPGERVLCIGTCTSEYAQALGEEHLEGCPPTVEQVEEFVVRRLRRRSRR